MVEYCEALTNIRKTIRKYYRTQKEFAEKNGMSEVHISRMMRGRRRMSLSFFINTCNATGISPNEIIGWRKTKED